MKPQKGSLQSPEELCHQRRQRLSLGVVREGRVPRGTVASMPKPHPLPRSFLEKKDAFFFGSYYFKNACNDFHELGFVVDFTVGL